MERISRREWTWVAMVCTVLIVVTGAPYLLATCLNSPGLVFSGSIIGVEDGNAYLAAMHEGAAGEWLFHIPFTPEPHQPGAVYFLYLLLGKLAHLTGLSLPVMLHVARLVTTPLLMFAIYRFAAFFTPWVYLRRLAFVLAATGAGLGWLWVAAGRSFELNQMPIDFWVPDAFAFLTVFLYPHMILAQALILLLAIGGVRLLDHPDWSRTILVAILGLALSAIHPYSLPLLLGLLGLLWSWRAIISRKPDWLALAQLVVIGLLNLPYLAYCYRLFATNPVFHSWQVQNRVLSPHPIYYVLGYGLVALLACVGLVHPMGLRRRTSNRFLVLWLLVVPILLYIPYNLQRRFLDGYQLPLVMAALAGTVCLLRRVPPRWRRRCVLLLAAVSAFTNILILTGATISVIAHTPPIFNPRPVVEAAQWMDANVPADSIVFASYNTGNVLPAYASVRTFVGHGPKSVNVDEKRRMVIDFFSTMSPEQRRSLLREYRVDYLFFGPGRTGLESIRAR